jgi:signal transduction histidine kinase
MFGLVTPVDISPARLYQSWPAASLVIFSIVGLLFNSWSLYKITINKLRARLEKEQSQKQFIMHELSKLEAPSNIGVLVNKIAHDVRSPLGAVAGFVDLMRRENALSPESIEDCSIMLSEIDRISNLINRMIKYAKPGQQEREPICPLDTLETVLSVLSFFPDFKSIRIEKDVPAAGQYLVFANKEEVQQVFFNLLKNSFEALSHSAGPKSIKIRIHPKNENLVFEFEDNGPGFPKHIVAALSHEIFTVKKEGAGLGLIIVREIIEANGGGLLISNRDEGGAHIAILWPLYKGELIENKQGRCFEKNHEK